MIYIFYIENENDQRVIKELKPNYCHSNKTILCHFTYKF